MTIDADTLRDQIFLNAFGCEHAMELADESPEERATLERIAAQLSRDAFEYAGLLYLSAAGSGA